MFSCFNVLPESGVTTNRNLVVRQQKCRHLVTEGSNVEHAGHAVPRRLGTTEVQVQMQNITKMDTRMAEQYGRCIVSRGNSRVAEAAREQNWLPP